LDRSNNSFDNLKKECDHGQYDHLQYLHMTLNTKKDDDVAVKNVPLDELCSLLGFINDLCSYMTQYTYLMKNDVQVHIIIFMH